MGNRCVSIRKGKAFCKDARPGSAEAVSRKVVVGMPVAALLDCHGSPVWRNGGNGYDVADFEALYLRGGFNYAGDAFMTEDMSRLLGCSAAKDRVGV